MFFAYGSFKTFKSPISYIVISLNLTSFFSIIK